MEKAKGMLVFDRTVGKCRRAIGVPPVLTSADTNWRGFVMERNAVPSFDVRDVYLLNPAVVLQLNQIEVEWKENGKYEPIRILPGNVSVIPQHLTHSIRCQEKSEFLALSFEPSFLAAAAQDSVAVDQLEFRPHLGKSDPLIQALAMSLLAELQSGGAMGELYAESLGNSLAVHLLRKYSMRRAVFPEHSGGLSRRQLLRALDYIHAHLSENLSLEAIAKAAGISPFHFARLFKQSMQETPHRYVLRCRVGRAKELLLQQDLPICAVASQAGFCDQSHLTFHFKRAYGTTPKAFLRMHMVGR